MSRGPRILPFFLSQEGCPHCCLYCNPRQVGAGSRSLGPEQVRQALADLPRSPGRSWQVAFYGGSFTCLPRQRQEELLAAVGPSLASGLVDSIRLSTRPDCISPDTAAFLRARGVGTVELGVQSMDDGLLAALGRGHGRAAVARAMELLRAGELRTGMQLMCGLPGETWPRLRASTEQALALRPDFIRIYPLLVLRGTALERLYREGRFRPRGLAWTVAACARLVELCLERDVPVIRLGVQEDRHLAGEYLAGPRHPALGELVRARIMCRRLAALLAPMSPGPVEIRVHPRDISLLTGFGGHALGRIRRSFPHVQLHVATDPALQRNGPIVARSG